MSAILDFPPIEPPPLVEQPKPPSVVVAEPAAALVPVSIKAAVLAQFKDAETTVLALVEKYRAVVFNVSTTKGMAEAKAARLELREKGRFALARAEKSVKDDVNDLKKVMAEEVERIVALVLPAEKAIDDQIKAEEDRKAAIKAKEAERVAAHQAGIVKIRAYLARCQEPGMTAERIGKGIELLAAVTFGPEWQEFAEKASIAQAETLTAMRELHAAVVEREAEAARAEQARLEREAEQTRVAEENERKAAELAERERALQVQADELAERERAAIAEQVRVADLQAKVAAIHARAAQFEEDRSFHSWDIFQTIVDLEGMDVSKDAFEEFAPMAADARRIVLAALLKAKDEAEAREAAAAAAVEEPARRYGGGRRSPAPLIMEEAAPTDAAGTAPIRPEETAEVEPDSTAADLFGAATPLAPAVVSLSACQDALREALLLVQELVTCMDQSASGVKAAHGILARVGELRALGGI